MTNTYLKTLAVSAFAVGLFALPLQSMASIVTIKNDTDSEVTAHIEPGEGKIVGSSHEIKHVLKANEKKVVEIKKDTLGDVEVFSIKGSVTVPSLYNRCTGLLMNRNYSIAFVPGKVGVVCYITDDSTPK